jgi:hypothetical protein
MLNNRVKGRFAILDHRTLATPDDTLVVLGLGLGFRSIALPPQARERMGSPTLQTLQNPILLLPWVCFPNPPPLKSRTWCWASFEQGLLLLLLLVARVRFVSLLIRVLVKINLEPIARRYSWEPVVLVLDHGPAPQRR